MDRDFTLGFSAPSKPVSAATTSKSTLMQTKFYPWIVWGLGAAFFFFEYIARVSTSVMVPDLMAEFHVSAYALGGLSAFFYYAYVGLQMPVGVLVDRFGVQRLLTVMALLTGFGCVLFATAKNLHLAELGRFLMGFGAAFAFVSTLKLVSIWFSATRVGLLSGLTQALGMLGAAVGEAPTALLVAGLGWRHSMWVMAGVFVLLALLIGLIVRDRPANQAIHASHSDTQLTKKFGGRLRYVLSNSQTWFNAVYAGLLYAPTAAFAELWGVSFFRQTYGLENHIAASAVGFIFIGWGIGGPIVGWISDRLQLRRPVLIASALIGFVLMSIVVFVPKLPIFLLFVLLFLYGVSNTGVAISYAVAAEINPRAIAGTSLGFTNMASVIVGALFQPLIGWFLDFQGNVEIINGVSTYPAESFRMAMAILPICLALSIVLALFVRETHCRSITRE